MVVRVQQVTVATGAVVSSDVVVAEMIAELVLIVLKAALVHVCRDRRQFWFWFWVWSWFWFWSLEPGLWF